MLNHNENYNYSYTFNEYLNDNSNNKFVAVVTKSQYAIEVTNSYPHEFMLADLINKTRPDIKTDSFGNALNPNESFINSNAVVLGYNGYVQIELPATQLLSFEQFCCLKNILLEFKKYNDKVHQNNSGNDYEIVIFGGEHFNIEPGNHENDIADVIDKMKKCVSNEVEIPNEVILGTRIIKDNIEQIDNSIMKKAV